MKIRKARKQFKMVTGEVIRRVYFQKHGYRDCTMWQKHLVRKGEMK
jgi:hypothetical protein